MKIIKAILWLVGALVMIACQKEDKLFYAVCCNSDGISDTPGNARIYLPTIFSPNGDGVNDHFFLFGDSVRKVVLFEIRNTRGKLVYQAKDVEANDHTKGWDGKVNGNVVKGIYAVTLVVEAIDRTIREYESSVCNYPCGQSNEVTSLHNCHYPDDWYCWQYFHGCLMDDLPECVE